MICTAADFTVMPIYVACGVRLPSSPGSRVCCWRAGCIFSRDLTYLIARGQDRSKDGCTSLPSAGGIVSVLGLWHKRALMSRDTRTCPCTVSASLDNPPNGL